MSYTLALKNFVHEINRATWIGEEEWGGWESTAQTFDEEFVHEDDPYSFRAWGPGSVHISIGCLDMTVNVSNGEYRSWHSTADDDPVTALNRGHEYPTPYDVVDNADAGAISWHNCTSVLGGEQDSQVNSLYAALLLWISPRLKITSLSMDEDSPEHYLCSPDPETYEGLRTFLISKLESCITLKCSGFQESKELLDAQAQR